MDTGGACVSRAVVGVTPANGIDGGPLTFHEISPAPFMASRRRPYSVPLISCSLLTTNSRSSVRLK